MNKAVIKKVAKWQNDIVSFVREEFKIEPDNWQQEVFEAYNRGEQRIAMQACVGPGKTFCLAVMGWHFLLTKLHSQGAVTSISEPNLRDGLWKELAHWRGKSPVLSALFHQTSTRIYAKDHPETWFLSFRTWAKAASSEQMSETLRGLHAENVLFILDEAGGIPDAVAVTAEAVLSTVEEQERGKRDARLIIAGNPTRLEGPLYRAATRERDLWWRIEITGDPDDSNRAPRVSKKWAQQMIDNFGRDHPWVIVNVFGKFPPGKFNALVSLEDVQGALNRNVPANWISQEPRIIGIDVARQGDDRSVVFPRQGRVAFRPAIYRIPNLVTLAGQIGRNINKFQPHAIFLDGDGFGSGLGDILRSQGFDVMDIGGSARATESMKYGNKRAENWWLMAQWIKKGACLPRIEGISNELTVVEFDFDGQGRLMIKSKKEIKKELGFSTDISDALSFTFAQTVNVYQNTSTDTQFAETEYDHWSKA